MLDDFKRKPLVFLVGATVGGIVGAIVIAAVLQFILGIRAMNSAVAQSFALAALPFAYLGGAYFVRFHDQNGWGVSWLWVRLTKSLTRPTQRALFLVGLIGLAVMAFTAIFSKDSILVFLETVFHPWFLTYHSRYWETVFFWVGFAMFAVGTTLSYGYDLTVGRVLLWLKQGTK